MTDSNGIISQTVYDSETLDDCSIRVASNSGVWLYVDGMPVKHVTPGELKEYVEE